MTVYNVRYNRVVAEIASVCGDHINCFTTLFLSPLWQICLCVHIMTHCTSRHYISWSVLPFVELMSSYLAQLFQGPESSVEKEMMHRGICVAWHLWLISSQVKQFIGLRAVIYTSSFIIKGLETYNCAHVSIRHFLKTTTYKTSVSVTLELRLVWHWYTDDMMMMDIEIISVWRTACQGYGFNVGVVPTVYSSM